MKINNLTPPSPILDQGKPSGTNRPESAPASAADALSNVHLSQAALDSSQDIDQAKVEELRLAIKEGRLAIKAENIADGLIDSIRGMLDKQTP